MRTRFAASIAAIALLAAGCSSSATPSPTATAAPATSAPASAAPASLTIYGASSLNAVLARVPAAYQAVSPGTTITISTDSSTALETKIEQGAPADIFLSADTANPQKLIDRGLAAGGRHEVRRQPADRHSPDRQSGRNPDSGRPGQKRRQGDRRRRHGADNQVREPARGEPRQAAGLPGQLRREATPRTSSPSRTTSPPSSPRSPSAKAMPRSST